MKETLAQSLLSNKAQPAPINNLFVSLYLVLLAFFIVLHSMSVYEETKTEAAVGSLRGVFRSPVNSQQNSLQQDEQQIAAEIVALLRDDFHLTEVKEGSDNILFQGMTDTDELFQAGSIAFDNALSFKLNELSSKMAFLQRLQSRHKYQLTFYMGLAAIADNPSQHDSLTIRRAKFLRTRLEEKIGTQAGQSVDVAFASIPSDDIIIRFRRVAVVNNSRLSLNAWGSD